MCGVLQCKDVWCEMDDVIAIAYETVVEVAEEALERGIAAGVCFDAIACGAVKKKFLRLRKYYGEKCRKADLVSYEAYFPFAIRLLPIALKIVTSCARNAARPSGRFHRSAAAIHT